MAFENKPVIVSRDWDIVWVINSSAVQSLANKTTPSESFLAALKLAVESTNFCSRSFTKYGNSKHEHTVVRFGP